MKLVTAILAKNEADRYLPRVITRCKEFSDDVLVLDDRSTDSTAKLAEEMGCKVKGRSILEGPAWGNESPARQELWNWAVEEAGDGWILVADADMTLQGNPRDLMETWEANAWAFILYDLWDPDGTVYRRDGHWQGHLHPRVWMVRPSTFGPDFTPQWPQRGIHTGHIPANAPLRIAIAPPDCYFFEHWSYAKPEDRIRKMQQYLGVEDQLTPFEREHARSILA